MIGRLKTYSICLALAFPLGTMAEDALEQDGAHGLETAIPLKPGVPLLVKKVLPTDCRLVRGFTHAPVDGRVDTRHAGGGVSEWSGWHGVPAVNYRLFNGNDGLHITLAEDNFNALLIRGGWRGRLYANVDTLTSPGSDTPVLCHVASRSGVFRRQFERPVRAQRLSFFYAEKEGKPLADVTFLQVSPGRPYQGSAEGVTFGIGEPCEPDAAIGSALSRRYGAEARAFRLGPAPGRSVSLKQGGFVHLISPAQDPSRGISAVRLDIDVAEAKTSALLTIHVQDVLDPRRECMATDFCVPGPGQFSVVLDTPDQAFLPPKAHWMHAPILRGPITPPELWVSIGASTPVMLSSAGVTLHRVPRRTALTEAGPWREFLLKGLFSTMSEPRPWMHLKATPSIREQIQSSRPIARYRTSLIELLECAKAARRLLPDDDVVRQYHEWLYQSRERDKPQPPPELPDDPGAPKWAVMIRETWRGLESMATWWLENRLVPNGELGGGVNDDTDLFQAWQCLPMIESEPLGARLKDTAARLAELALAHKLEEGINRRTMDALHAYEEGVNQLALCAWWFYGDPVHFERAMISARSAAKLMVETQDGRVHFGSNHLGIENVRHGYQKLGATPGTFNWAPARLFLHPIYVAAMYNRGSAALARFERWGQTWADYQQPNAFVDKVDINTSEPIRVTKLPPSANIGPVVEWLTLYQLTRDPKWHRVFKMGIDGKGYSGAPVQYGRCPHALVAWKEPYQSFMRRKSSNPDSGYAGFFVTKDRSKLDKWLARSASWYGRFRHLFSGAEQKTDRILTYRATTPIACYLGDAPNRNRWLNLTAVSYEGLRGEDFAALVWDAGPARLHVAIYSFAHTPLTGRVRVWRLDHGRYRVRIGPDADDDGAMDRATEERTMELQRHSPIEVALPPRQVTVLKVEQLTRLDDIRERADLALSPVDTRLDSEGRLAVRVHSIGSKPVQRVRVVLERGGRVVDEELVEAIEAPLDLAPRVAIVSFRSARIGDKIVVDPDDDVPEIAECNNRLTVAGPPE